MLSCGKGFARLDLDKSFVTKKMRGLTRFNKRGVRRAALNERLVAKVQGCNDLTGSLALMFARLNPFGSLGLHFGDGLKHGG